MKYLQWTYRPCQNSTLKTSFILARRTLGTFHVPTVVLAVDLRVTWIYYKKILKGGGTVRWFNFESMELLCQQSCGQDLFLSHTLSSFLSLFFSFFVVTITPFLPSFYLRCRGGDSRETSHLYHFRSRMRHSTCTSY